MPTAVTLLVSFVMLAAMAALCIRIAGARRRRRAMPVRRAATATTSDGTMDTSWSNTSCTDGDPSMSPSSWSGAGGACGGAGASGGWDAGGADGSGDGGGGGD